MAQVGVVVLDERFHGQLTVDKPEMFSAGGEGGATYTLEDGTIVSKGDMIVLCKEEEDRHVLRKCVLLVNTNSMPPQMSTVPSNRLDLMEALLERGYKRMDTPRRVEHPRDLPTAE